MKKITIPYFPMGLKIASPVLALAGIWLVVQSHPVWGTLLVLLCIIILTTRYVTEIDLQKKVCRDYLSVVGVAFDKEEKRFNAADRILITKGNYAQRANTIVQSRTVNWTDYTGTLVFDNDDSLDLLTHTSKRDLILGLKEFATFLNVGIEDRSTSHHYWVDIAQVEKE